MNRMQLDEMPGAHPGAIEDLSMMKRYIRFLFESLRKCFTVTKYFLFYFGFKFIIAHGIK